MRPYCTVAVHDRGDAQGDRGPVVVEPKCPVGMAPYWIITMNHNDITIFTDAARILEFREAIDKAIIAHQDEFAAIGTDISQIVRTCCPVGHHIPQFSKEDSIESICLKCGNDIVQVDPAVPWATAEQVEAMEAEARADAAIEDRNALETGADRCPPRE